MKTLVRTLLIACCAIAAFAADATGKWSGTFTPEGQDGQPAYVILKQSGSALTGSGGPDESQQWPINNGKVEGNRVTGDVTAPDGTIYKLDVVMDGDKLTGGITAVRDGQTMKAKIELNRVKA